MNVNEPTVTGFVAANPGWFVFIDYGHAWCAQMVVGWWLGGRTIKGSCEYELKPPCIYPVVEDDPGVLNIVDNYKQRYAFLGENATDDQIEEALRSFIKCGWERGRVWINKEDL